MLDTGYLILVEGPDFGGDTGKKSRYQRETLELATRNKAQMSEVGGQKSEKQVPSFKFPVSNF